MFKRLVEAYDAFVDTLFKEEEEDKPKRKVRDCTKLTEEQKVEARLMYAAWRKDHKTHSIDYFVPIFNRHFGTDKSPTSVYRILVNGGS
jgi:hypothetical protein